jgi:acyl-coenzyme A synthetase/AMP-(fatty) acid ligase
MPNGKQVNLETMEAELTGAPELAQVRLVVEQQPTWKLVAVTFPAVDTLEAGATDTESLQRLVREAFRRQSRGFPSWLRVDEIRLVDEPLPVTRLGKVRRIELPAGPFDFDRWRDEAERIASPAQG